MTISLKNAFNCETCILSIQVVPHSRIPDDRAKAPLEFVHTDIAGPIEPIVMGGFRYAINFKIDIITFFKKSRGGALATKEVIFKKREGRSLLK